ncbi:hypothetical protein K9L16_04035 [Candidatus Pacearchaeota archaeon]|nr:hypothetical protein [Candidatus Pacearchaeota archaeon]
MLIPAQIFVGHEDLLIQETEKILQSYFCKNKDSKNCFCSECKKIKNHQHESIIWINPEKNYSVKDLDIIFEKISFKLERDQKFFFILQKAQYFNDSSANKLLKVLEEPPTGYNFILHTNNLNVILPTIKSRCYIVNFVDNNLQSLYSHPLLSFFYNNNLDSPVEFEKELKKLNLSDNQSIELINEMLNFYAQKIIESHKADFNSDKENLEKFEKIFEFIKEKIKKLPQSGSSNIFWKNLYISFPVN